MAPAVGLEDWLPFAAAAAEAGVCKRSIQRWADAKKVRVRVLAGKKLVEMSEVRRYASRPRTGDLRPAEDSVSLGPPAPVPGEIEALRARVGELERGVAALHARLDAGGGPGGADPHAGAGEVRGS